MRSSLRRLLIASAAVAAVTASLTPGATAAERDVIASADKPVHVVAVTGPDDRLWVRYTNQPSWFNLGGALVDAPAVARGYRADYFVGVGADGNVWIRSLTRGWQPLAPANTRCAGASAVVSGNQLGVACRGGDGALWAGFATLPNNDTLPYVKGFASRGGSFRHGVSISDIADSTAARFIYSGVGLDNRPYSRTDNGSWTSGTSATCSASFATSEFYEVGACRDTRSEGMLSFPIGQGGTVRPVNGRTIGRPGVAVLVDGEARIYALGLDGSIWVARHPAGGVPGGFVRFGGAGKHGISAASFS
ncbi:MAG TPA: hypothetical protein VM433_01095 [Mycobacteriales bacterium]|nr:hypothetical protein [Mycobacteriales bacterium]